MTLKDLASAGLIKDEDCIKLIRPMAGKLLDVRRGNWYQDFMLDWFTEEIAELRWTKEKGFEITIETAREE